VLSRSLLLLVGALGLLGAATGCTALTRPDDITIAAEPTAATAPEAPAPSPQQPIPLQAMPAKAPGGGG
jgi:hypothetical protein